MLVCFLFGIGEDFLVKPLFEKYFRYQLVF